MINETLKTILTNLTSSTQSYIELKEKLLHELQSLNLSTQDWTDFKFWEDSKYTRNLILENDDFEVILLCWNKKVKSNIHDHSTDGCFIVGIEGDLTEEKFERKSDGSIEKVKELRILKGDVSWMHDSIGLHRTGNWSDDKVAVTLHIYCPPLKKCCVYNNDGSRSFTKTSYFSVNGNPVIQ